MSSRELRRHQEALLASALAQCARTPLIRGRVEAGLDSFSATRSLLTADEQLLSFAEGNFTIHTEQLATQDTNSILRLVEHLASSLTRLGFEFVLGQAEIGLQPTAVQDDDARVGGSSLTERVYIFDRVRYWMALQTLRVIPIASRRHADDLVDWFAETTQFYELSRKFLLAIIHHFETADSTAEHHAAGASTEEGQYIWQSILLFQLVGEHIGFMLKNLPMDLEHMWGHGQVLNQADDNALKMIGSVSYKLSLDWGRNRGLSRRFLLHLGRCPNEAAFLESLSDGKMSITQLHVQNVGCFQGQPSPSDPNHGLCSASACVKATTARPDSKQRHLPSCSGCDEVETPMVELCGAIDAGFLPLLIIDPGTTPDSPVQLRVLRRSKQRGEQLSYIAISHVWADGRGNPDRNALPACQLRFLHSICGLSPDLAIWMDTLCIPVQKAHADRRKEAIRNMNEIYLQAAKVIVVSSDLLRIDFQPSFHHDAWLQVQSSAWMRRFWTLQEGAFASGDGVGKPDGRLFICFKDGLVRFDSESHSLSILSHLSPAWTFNPKLRDIFTNIRSLSRRERSGELVYKILEQFQWRDTSWKVDQPVIMAGLLGIDPTPVSQPSWENQNVAVHQRLEQLYKRLDSFPTDVLYSTVSKLKTSGLRWAPQTLKIPRLLAPFDLMGVEKYGPVHSGGGYLLGDKYGKVHSRGLDYWGHAIVFSLPPTETSLPGSFRVLLDDSRCRGNCHSVPQLLLDVEVQRIEYDGRKEDPPELSGQSDVVDEKEVVSLSLLIRCFGRHYAAQDGYESPAAIMRVTKGAQVYRSYCSDTLGNPLVRRAREWLHAFDPTAQYLAGPYLMPARVRSVPEHIREVSNSIQCPECESYSERHADSRTAVLHNRHTENPTSAPFNSQEAPVSSVASSSVSHQVQDVANDTYPALSAKARGKQPDMTPALTAASISKRGQNGKVELNPNIRAANIPHDHITSQQNGVHGVQDLSNDSGDMVGSKSFSTSQPRTYDGYYYENPFRIIVS